MTLYPKLPTMVPHTEAHLFNLYEIHEKLSHECWFINETQNNDKALEHWEKQEGDKLLAAIEVAEFYAFV